jgi:GNAT superfamily N-acetyltransferase
MEYEVRPARPHEGDFLAQSWRAMMDELALAPGGFAPDWRERLARYFSEGIVSSSQGWFVADVRGRPVGCAAAMLPATATAAVQLDRMATLAGVYVMPAHRRAGMARALVLRSIEWARTRGCAAVRLQSSATGERLYRSLGFEDGRELVLRFPKPGSG